MKGIKIVNVGLTGLKRANLASTAIICHILIERVKRHYCHLDLAFRDQQIGQQVVPA